MTSSIANGAALRVGIDARLRSGQPGGVQQVIIGLASGLSRLDAGDEEYHFLVYPSHFDWLVPYLDGSCRLLFARPEPSWKRIAKAFPPTAFALRAARGLSLAPWTNRAEPRVASSSVPSSDGSIEAACLHLIHFPKQDAFLTRVPSIYHPHDIQHVHYPEFFSEELRNTREVHYRTLCEQASMVSVTSCWTANDVASHFGLPDEKMAVVHLAPALSAYEPVASTEIDRVAAAFSTPERFILYPAQTWAHKNHIRLLEALDAIRRRYEVSIPLICTSTKNEFYATIQAKVRELRMQDTVLFTGFVSPTELRALYELAHCVVVPSLFEAAGGFGPIAEAFMSRRPVACSNVTSLPDEVGDAALLFDPFSVDDIAECVWRLWTRPELCRTLVVRGCEKVARYDWLLTARIFRAHYRRLTGFPLGKDDVRLLAMPPLY